MTEPSGCRRARDVIPELATGTLSGEERAAALHHVNDCPGCRRQLEEAARLVDALTSIAPAEEPPPAFESRVLARIAEVRKPSLLRRLTPYLITALVVSMVAGGTVWRVTEADRELAAGYRATLQVADGRYLTAAGLYSGREAVGHVFGYQGSPSWLVFTMEEAEGSYQAILVGLDGGLADLGRFTLSGRQRSWSTTVEQPIGQIAEIHLRRPGFPDMVARFRR
ncbi:zf-HC2 domain-containing protein [Nonomuraea sp. K274]|uniref:Zf-HC2 domain-containing protein n=1 Tax=Nonomuraea cypriaca TaxID=1187855 RepID=A0A931A6Q7_9ACTN|nr:zf-HC2 domain-containing protein [Nonomuraea cypriaca]MBF8184375.1 zf-HC2 domain-containing protein [Nonomuraea cypriaca]